MVLARATLGLVLAVLTASAEPVRAQRLDRPASTFEGVLKRDGPLEPKRVIRPSARVEGAWPIQPLNPWRR